MIYDQIQQVTSLIPGHVKFFLGLSLILLLASWIYSIYAGWPRKRWRALFIFPVTNPFMTAALAVKDWKTGRKPLAMYALTALVYFLGGWLSFQWESRAYQAYVQQLEASGEDLSSDQYRKSPIPDERNVWAHPFLKLLAEAGRYDEEGEKARGEMASHYAPLEMPRLHGRIQYADAGESRYSDPWKTLHEAALVQLESEQGSLESSTGPQTWNQCGALALKYAEKSDAEWMELSEALSRPEDRFPFEWDQGFAMLLPHLSKLKLFAQNAALRASAQAATGEEQRAWESTRLGFRTIQLGGNDLLISRLVQIAQLKILLDGVRIAQQFHAWNDAQWEVLRSELSTLNFIEEAADSIRAERVFAHETIHPMIRMKTTEIIRHADQLGSSSPAVLNADEFSLRAFQGAINVLFANYSNAVMARQWRLCLTFYDDIIDRFEQTAGQYPSQPMAQAFPQWEEERVLKYGFFARLLIPALGNVFQKYLQAQLYVQTASTACLLERYYLANGRYPESLEALTPEFSDEIPRDPMDLNPLRYERKGEKGFLLYSAGVDGRDDHGLWERKNSSHDESPDDIGWSVEPEPPALPEFNYFDRGAPY